MAVLRGILSFSSARVFARPEFPDREAGRCPHADEGNVATPEYTLSEAVIERRNHVEHSLSMRVEFLSQSAMTASLELGL